MNYAIMQHPSLFRPAASTALTLVAFEPMPVQQTPQPEKAMLCASQLSPMTRLPWLHNIK